MVNRRSGEWKIGQQRPRSLADQAYEAIEEMIVTRRLEPGAMVSESELGDELGLGRTPIREALARLKSIGFVEVHPRRGVLVSTVDVVRHLELLEVRRPLEESIVRCAAERATQADLDELQALSQELGEAAIKGDRVAYFRTKRSLHEAEVRAAYNTVLTTTMQGLHAQSRRFWYTYEPTDSFTQGAKHHAVVARHVIARDANAAVKAVGTLFAFLERLTRNAVDRRADVNVLLRGGSTSPVLSRRRVRVRN
jgi:DNA-binding GntR family transcriptional regulator